MPALEELLVEEPEVLEEWTWMTYSLSSEISSEDSAVAVDVNVEEVNVNVLREELTFELKSK
jgi:hypothetical protein